MTENKSNLTGFLEEKQSRERKKLLSMLKKDVLEIWLQPNEPYVAT